MLANLVHEALNISEYWAWTMVDIKNAFNSANENWIKGTLAYISVRPLWYKTGDRPKKYIVTAGILQGSVLAFLSCKIMNDRMLRPHVPEEAILINSADVLALMVVLKHPDDVKLYGSETIHIFKLWSRIVKMELADEKTEETLISNQKNSAGLLITTSFQN